jgi:DNA repair protein RadC
MTTPITAGIDHLGDDRLVEVLAHPRRENPDLLRRIRDVLDREDGLLGIANATPGMLRQAGLPMMVARRLAAACELGRRVAMAKRRARPTCRSPEETVALMAPEIAALPNEELWVLPLDNRLGLIAGARMVSRGSPSGTEADPAVILRMVLSAGSSSFVVVHQHPSGDPSPSVEDRAITTRIAAAGRLLSVPLRDHIVIGDGGRFVSLRRENPDLFH